ncbi:MAG: 16S rRNA (guanine(527)-N(7))-methyltransferase RsmG [Terriglobales bacterium]
MDPKQISRLLQPFLPLQDSPIDMSSLQLNDISTYIDMLLRWNAHMNLTSVRQPEEMVTRHFGESLFAARYLFPVSPTVEDSDEHVFDLGSGAGFPGIPLKIWNPTIRLTLIESNGKKATFLREVVRRLQLDNVTVEAKRAEDLKKAQADTITLRAVEKFANALPIATELLKQGGTLALLIGSKQASRVASLTPAIRWQAPVSVPLSSQRVLLIGIKIELGPSVPRGT